ncbi:hypothetical protein GGX14DRAFT_399512 [Mycena pura]|uniref:Uncharacterized protein n=1 Tax=Mycena pura TaxID=153505 RepID=A0AAD6Y5E3_9AGAR|nr:hypothetical protein GGX14DRAFT_399512 [Mycena pura]
MAGRVRVAATRRVPVRARRRLGASTARGHSARECQCARFVACGARAWRRCRCDPTSRVRGPESEAQAVAIGLSRAVKILLCGWRSGEWLRLYSDTLLPRAGGTLSMRLAVRPGRHFTQSYAEVHWASIHDQRNGSMHMETSWSRYAASAPMPRCMERININSDGWKEWVTEARDCDHVVPVCNYDYGLGNHSSAGNGSVIVHVVRSPRSSRHLIRDIIQYDNHMLRILARIPSGLRAPNHPDSIRVGFEHSEMSLGPAGVTVMCHFYHRHTAYLSLLGPATVPRKPFWGALVYPALHMALDHGSETTMVQLGAFRELMYHGRKHFELKQLSTGEPRIKFDKCDIVPDVSNGHRIICRNLA